MEFIIAELINTPKIPKWLRYVIVTAICGAIIVLGVMLAINAPCSQTEIRRLPVRSVCRRRNLSLCKNSKKQQLKNRKRFLGK